MKPIENYFVFGTESSIDNHLRIESKDIYGGAEPEMDEYEIPGKDGTVFVDKKRRKNITVTYDTFLKAPDMQHFDSFITKIKGWLMANPACYKRLEDTYDTEHFRKAVYTGGLEVESDVKGYSRQSINFSCLPYRYLKHGEIPISSLEGVFDVVNKTAFEAMPTINIWHRETTTPNMYIHIYSHDENGEEANASFNISNINRYQSVTYVDTETMTAYGTNEEGTNTYINDITGLTGGSPYLPVGSSVVEITANGLRVATLTPNWREL